MLELVLGLEVDPRPRHAARPHRLHDLQQRDAPALRHALEQVAQVHQTAGVAVPRRRRPGLAQAQAVDPLLERARLARVGVVVRLQQRVVRVGQARRLLLRGKLQPGALVEDLRHKGHVQLAVARHHVGRRQEGPAAQRSGVGDRARGARLGLQARVHERAPRGAQLVKQVRVGQAVLDGLAEVLHAAGAVGFLQVVVHPAQQDLVWGQREERLQCLPRGGVHQQHQLRVLRQRDAVQQLQLDQLPHQAQHQDGVALHDVVRPDVHHLAAHRPGRVQRQVQVLHLVVDAEGAAGAFPGQVEAPLVHRVRLNQVHNLAEQQAVVAALEEVVALGRQRQPGAQVRVAREQRRQVVRKGRLLLVRVRVRAVRVPRAPQLHSGSAAGAVHFYNGAQIEDNYC
mmetsp:Transcript_39818/g.65252  ORF Transcript_39818/g.65252 Transcript_39818/m.65252 type:complete len:398 (-) Transcript_39818:557-1750(-)